MKEYRTGRYEHSSPESGVPEFWQAERVYGTVTIIFGKLGSKGIRASREFSSSAEAQQFIESRLQEKIDEGFTKAE